MIFIPVNLLLGNDLICVKLFYSLDQRGYKVRQGSFQFYGVPRVRFRDGFLSALSFLPTSHGIQENLRDVVYCKMKLVIVSVQLKEKQKYRAVKTRDTFPQQLCLNILLSCPQITFNIMYLVPL